MQEVLGCFQEWLENSEESLENFTSEREMKDKEFELLPLLQNVDVPITSHYRQGPKRKRGRPQKHLTGNAYYAAIGKKGGRPKLYG